MWRTEPITMDQNRNRPPIQSERTNMSKPQIFVQLAFGVSWSRRHAPQTHTLTYMSRNLKNARDSGNFPRQVPPPNTNFLDVPESRQHRSRDHPGRHHQHHHQRQQNRQHSNTQAQVREHGRPRGQTGDYPNEHGRTRLRVGSRSEARGTSHERGRSAPPPFNDSPWDVHQAPSASLFPQRSQTDGDEQAWKTLPASPGQFRLGEDGLPWSGWEWPGGDSPDEGEGEGQPYANNPTTVPLTTERPRSEDLERARELESLSTAMMTVDNGFENQWWNQGQRESVESWWPQEAEDEVDDARTEATAEAMLLPDLGSPFTMDYNEEYDEEEQLPNLGDIVSPISDASSPAQSFSRPLFRSLTTRSEELWLGR